MSKKISAIVIILGGAVIATLIQNSSLPACVNYGWGILVGCGMHATLFSKD